MHIPVILGTSRDGRQSEKVAIWMLNQIESTEATSEIIDTRDYQVPITDASESSDTAKSYIKKIESADALVVVVPEYNHGYPGELKMMLDLCYKQYAGRPVLLCGVSSGGLGGARVVEQMTLITVALGMVPMQRSLYFSNVEDLFDDAGHPKDDSYTKRAASALDTLKKYASALETVR